MQKIFKKENIMTVPNLLSLFRLALIPVIIWFYSVKHKYRAAIGLILLSGASDIADGFIARHFNMVSDLGKILDPIADKLTQGALLVCLISKFKAMWSLIIIFSICEILMVLMGIIAIRKSDRVCSARWHGKLNTVVIYSSMMALIIFQSIPVTLANIMIALCNAVTILSLVLYARFYLDLIIKR